MQNSLKFNGGFNGEDVVRTSVLGRRIEIFLDQPIGMPDEHREEIHAIRSAGPDDCVILYLNTPGGVLATAQAIMNAMYTTPAEVLVVLEGMIASAGTMIACAASNVQVMPHTQFMIHSASGGEVGILRNNARYAEFSQKVTEKLMRDVYEDFLTEEELIEVFNGRELWFDDDETLARFQARAEKRNKKADTEEQTD